MKVLFDTQFLIWAIRPDSPPEEIPNAQDKIDFLLKTLDETKAKIFIPTPVLAEFLSGLTQDDESTKNEYINAIMRNFSLASFNTMCAIEHAEVVKFKSSEHPWQKVKFDFQIVTIAKVNSVDMVYTHDSDIKRLCETNEINVTLVSELKLPEPAPQIEMFDNDN